LKEFIVLIHPFGERTKGTAEFCRQSELEVSTLTGSHIRSVLKQKSLNFSVKAFICGQDW
jgi:hypothetical protein